MEHAKPASAALEPRIRSAHASVAARRLEQLAAPLVPTLVSAEIGDTVRLAQSDGAWFYCRVEERTPDGDLVCRVVDAQGWPLVMIEGIVPGVKYVVPPECVLSVVRLRG